MLDMTNVDAQIDRDEAGVREAATAIGRGCHAAALDVTSETSIAEMVGAVVAQNGGIDILVNNAAVFDLGPVLEVTRKSFDRLFDVNVRGLFFTLQAVARQMVERGRGGKIINMASQAGHRGEALVSVYCATKAAVINLTQSAGLDLIKYRINVNGISPGVVDTPMWDEVDALFARYENRPSERRSAWSARPCHSAAWGCRTIMSARPSFWRPPMPTMSSPRLSTSTAAIG
jgi:D-sorbitol dehydrogenase (acceptor)